MSDPNEQPEQTIERLKKDTEKLKTATENLEQEIRIKHALAKIDDKEILKANIKTLKGNQKKSVQSVGQALQDSASLVLEEEYAETVTQARKKALEELAKAPARALDWPKVLCVLGVLAIIGAATWGLTFVGETKAVLIIFGLVVSAAGQIADSVGKAGDVQTNPRFMDGLALLGESLKVFGVLAAIVGFALGLKA